MDKAGNVLFCGVGGQGILLASEVTAHALIESGFDVKKSEVHGMAQRGGSVVAHLRFGGKVYSPLIEPGTADLAIAFELLESVRYLPFLDRKSQVIVNTQKISPPSVATGKAQYPQGLINEFSKRGIAAFPLDALAIAEELGEIRAVNMVLVGALSTFLPVDEQVFARVIRQRVPARFLKVNQEAFAQGRRIVRATQR